MVMTKPVISIIMPTFNRLQFLRPAVDSVFAQTFTDWELIIADDGSGAETRDYLQGLGDPRVRVLWLAHTGKPSVVSNIALREALESLRKHPERKWSYTKFALVDGSGSPIVSARIREWPTPTGWILEKLLEEETVIAQPSVVVSRRLLERLGAFDEELVMCYDDELWFRLAAHSQIDGIDEPLTLIRRHGHHSGGDIIAWRDRRRVFEKALRTSDGSHPAPILRRLRAQMSAGLAKSQAASGKRMGALATLLMSLPHSWAYPRCWLGALGATARSFAPASLRALARRYRQKRRVHSMVP
jgi:glycosyltransferase involved in cell wall biosynthesis